MASAAVAVAVVAAVAAVAAAVAVAVVVAAVAVVAVVAVKLKFPSGHVEFDSILPIVPTRLPTARSHNDPVHWQVGVHKPRTSLVLLALSGFWTSSGYLSIKFCNNNVSLA
ncbi:hypothetical protein [Coleofasciculus sp. E1-EBD-02]|uniref:hypothetical protein n=1 Tax=Coleofasciculus sp. E1-EBD-02 TaxID=3068481 RepID=UPI0033010779